MIGDRCSQIVIVCRWLKWQNNNIYNKYLFRVRVYSTTLIAGSVCLCSKRVRLLCWFCAQFEIRPSFSNHKFGYFFSSIHMNIFGYHWLICDRTHLATINSNRTDCVPLCSIVCSFTRNKKLQTTREEDLFWLFFLSRSLYCFVEHWLTTEPTSGRG